jgi:hypothetical protein
MPSSSPDYDLGAVVFWGFFCLPRIKHLLTHQNAYGGNGTVVRWSGEQVDDVEGFKKFLGQQVRDRLHDIEERERFEAEIRALATSEMAVGTLERLLASVPNKESWEVGEAMAECLLESKRGVRWVSHPDRDKRTPKASLPGADLVGFVGDESEPWLALGEVKTSSDAACPPGVMSGRSGMVHQLDELARRFDIHQCLLRWMRPRCTCTDLWPIYQKAVRRYLSSEGRGIVLYGMLMRDTAPSELDLLNRAKAVGRTVTTPTSVFLAAWYLPVPISEWVACTERAA